jgi:hypothetical protein
MPRLTTLVLGFFAAILCGSILAANTPSTIQSLNKTPLSFTKNVGQWDDRVLFRANAGGATMWFTKEGVTYQFTRRIDNDANTLSTAGVGQNRFGFDASGTGTGTPQLAVGDDRLNNTRDSIDQLVLTAKFIGANPNLEIIAEGQLEYKCNYFFGNDPVKWHTDVPNYEAITLKDIYPGIDLKYSGDGSGQAAYEFIAAPGAKIAQIKVAYEGAEETSLDSDGRMILKTKWGDMTAAIGSGVNGTGLASPRFAVNSESTLGSAASSQSPAQTNSGTLSLSYSTYLGGGNNDEGNGIAVDGNGSAYVTGRTCSTDFPTLNPYQATYQGGDAWGGDVFVTKFSSSGNSLIYSTYIGGGDDDWGYSIAVDSSGNAYVTGQTFSPNFPIRNPYQSTFHGSYSGGDAFVTKLSSSGRRLIYSTYLGGGAHDSGRGIAVDSGGSAYVSGTTSSSDFPTLNPYQMYQGGIDAFVTKLSNSGSSLIYSTYLGGGDDDAGLGIAIDGIGNTYVTGGTYSSNFPTLNPYQTFQGCWDVFVTKLSGSGISLIYSTYLGGEGDDCGYGIAVDGNGNAYVTGETSSSSFPTLNPFQTYQSASDAFVTKLSSSGNSLIYSTYLGAGSLDQGRGIAVVGGGSAYVTGGTYSSSSDFPTLNPFQTHQESYFNTEDVFVTKLSSTGNSLIYSTYLGGESWDEGSCIAVDASGNAYVIGNTGSSNFPTLNPYQTYQNTWESDVFVTKLTWTPDYLCGDVNTDEQVDLLDAVFLINYIFVGGPAPQTLSLGDVNCSGGTINIADVVLLINYIFRSGPAPCTECG